MRLTEDRGLTRAILKTLDHGRKAVVALMVVAGFTLLSAVHAQADDLFDYPETGLNGMISAEFSQSLESCRRICQTRSGCVGFDYSNKQGNCRIFASIGGARGDAAFVSGARNLISGYKDPTNPPLASRFEKLKQTDTNGSQLLALGQEAFQKGDKNIGLQAVNLALQRGNKDAKLEIATWYDPRTFASDRVPSVDANKAARSYFELALEGNPRANDLLASLCRENANTASTYASSFGSFLGSTYCEGSTR